MQIVIDIPDRIYKRQGSLNIIDSDILRNALKNGTPLPKNHGRLIDEKDVIENICEAHCCYGHRHNNCKSKSDNFCGAWDVVENAPTIIEADISGKE